MNVEKPARNVPSATELQKKLVPERVRVLKKSVDPALLEIFAKDKSEKVRLAVYYNEFTPNDVRANIFVKFLRSLNPSPSTSKWHVPFSKIKTYLKPLRQINFKDIDGKRVGITIHNMVFYAYKHYLRREYHGISNYLQRLTVIFKELSHCPSISHFISQVRYKFYYGWFDKQSAHARMDEARLMFPKWGCFPGVRSCPKDNNPMAKEIWAFYNFLEDCEKMCVHK